MLGQLSMAVHTTSDINRTPSTPVV